LAVALTVLVIWSSAAASALQLLGHGGLGGLVVRRAPGDQQVRERGAQGLRRARGPCGLQRADLLAGYQPSVLASVAGYAGR
jgi:hypothetical protein